jgi:hypothetical protein
VTTPVADPTDLARRLERFRAARSSGGDPAGPLPHRPLGSAELAARLADTLDGEVVEPAGGGRFVRIEGRTSDIPVDRDRLARLPGQPPPDRPLVCLDTETTGLATAAGTVAFCIGLGWWDGPAFRQVQLLLPDHPDETAMLDELARHIPSDAWLVTYNGRGFDWPLLVARYRLARRPAPVHEGHLDLLPIVRRLFRHRMTDARLRSVETFLLGLVRHDDVDGWEIPERYLGFLRGGPPGALAAVVRHNDEDVRSLGRLLALLDAGYATPEARRSAPSGDLAGLARAFVRARRTEDALACLDEVLARDETDPGMGSPGRAVGPGPVRQRHDRPPVAMGPASEPWWSPRARPDFGGRPRRSIAAWPPVERAAFGAAWDRQRIAIDRAHLLRRLGRHAASVDAWTSLAAEPGRTAVIAWVEIAKLREHRLADRDGAIEATLRGIDLAERRRHLGLPEPALEADLRHRLARLRRRGASGQRLVHGDLTRRRRDDQPPDALPDGPVANREQVGDTAKPHVLHRQRPGRSREPELRPDPSPKHAGK